MTTTQQPVHTTRQVETTIAIRVWQVPVRVLHWTIVATIIVLSVSGYYIGNPGIFPAPSPNSMATVRAVHVVTGLIFAAALVARLIYMFTGNQWAHWRQFVPLGKERRKLIPPSVRYYLYLEREPPPVVGHNPLAGMTYLVVYAMLVAQTFAGIALMAADERGHGWEWAVGGWVFHLLPVPTIRFIHHLVMWLVWGFFVHHMYAAILVDREERSGEISSIVTGWKVLPRRRVETEIRQWRRRHATKHR